MFELNLIKVDKDPGKNLYKDTDKDIKDIDLESKIQKIVEEKINSILQKGFESRDLTDKTETDIINYNYFEDLRFATFENFVVDVIAENMFQDIKLNYKEWLNDSDSEDEEDSDSDKLIKFNARRWLLHQINKHIFLYHYNKVHDHYNRYDPDSTMPIACYVAPEYSIECINCTQSNLIDLPIINKYFIDYNLNYRLNHPNLNEQSVLNDMIQFVDELNKYICSFRIDIDNLNKQKIFQILQYLAKRILRLFALEYIMFYLVNSKHYVSVNRDSTEIIIKSFN